MKKYTLNIYKILEELDKRNLYIYENLSQDEQKEVSKSLLVLMKWMTTVASNSQDFYLVSVNETLNKGFWDIQKYPDLILKILALTGCGVKLYHPWVFSKKTSSNKLEHFLEKCFPNYNKQEINIIKNNITEAELKELLEEKEESPKDIIKEFNERFINA